MKSAFFGVAAVAALALTTGTASAHPPGYYYGGPVIVRPAPVIVRPAPVFVAPQPAFGFGNSFSFGVARPGLTFGFSTFDARPAFGSFYAPPLYTFPGYGYRGYGWRW
jgi:hypothetical protein